MKVAITCNILPSNYLRESGDDTFAEFDSPDTVNEIKNSLLNHSQCGQVEIVEANQDAYQKLRQGNFDFVFNIAEGLKGEAREAQIPAMLEMLDIPHTGSGVTTLAITLDKRRTKESLYASGIRTPGYQLLHSWNEYKSRLDYPLFVKPNNEGSSRGITAKSLATCREELENAVSEIVEAYRQPALVEEYLPGKEFTVGLVGNSPQVLPIVEVSFDHLPSDAPKFDCYEVKWIYDSLEANCETTFCPAKIDKDLENRIYEAAVETFRALDIKDLCRIDLRLDENGQPSIIDVNALPGLIPDPAENSRFPKAAYAGGYTYQGLIWAIFDSALERVGML